MELIEAIHLLVTQDRGAKWNFKAVKDSQGGMYEFRIDTAVTADELVSIVRTLNAQLEMFEG